MDRTFGGYITTCLLQFLLETPFTCLKGESNRVGKTPGILTAVSHLRILSDALGAWTFRVTSEQSNEFFLHILLLLIGESLSDAITPGSRVRGEDS